MQCSVLMHGTVMNVTVTEKNGTSHAAELVVEDFSMSAKENTEMVKNICQGYRDYLVLC